MVGDVCIDQAWCWTHKEKEGTRQYLSHASLSDQCSDYSCNHFNAWDRAGWFFVPSGWITLGSVGQRSSCLWPEELKVTMLSFWYSFLWLSSGHYFPKYPSNFLLDQSLAFNNPFCWMKTTHVYDKYNIPMPCSSIVDIQSF